jgi:hypothetical protein
LLAEFFPVHGNVVRGGDAQSDGFAFGREDGDHQLAVRHRNHYSFTDLATEEELEAHLDKLRGKRADTS